MLARGFCAGLLEKHDKLGDPLGVNIRHLLAERGAQFGAEVGLNGCGYANSERGNSEEQAEQQHAARHVPPFSTAPKVSMAAEGCARLRYEAPPDLVGGALSA